jgi:broad specificity phosphatase PhoE
MGGAVPGSAEKLWLNLWWSTWITRRALEGRYPGPLRRDGRRGAVEMGKYALAVDDDFVVRALSKAKLESVGQTVKIAENDWEFRPS